jgi:uncharacterized RDD family membrane protein YckC
MNMVYAGFWKRFVALVIDTIVFFIILAILMIVPFFPHLLAVILAGYYHVVFETSPLRATPGKALMKLSVVKSDGRQLTIKDSCIRYVLSFFSGMFVCLGYLISLFTDKKQTFHDMMADTVVIEEVFAEHNFWQIFVSQSKIIFATEGSNNNSFAEKNVNSQSLEELYNLHQKGILTDEEYKMKKEEYLKKL